MSELPTIEFVTESGARRRIAYERVRENQRVVRRVSHYDGDGWRPVGQDAVHAAIRDDSVDGVGAHASTPAPSASARPRSSMR